MDETMNPRDRIRRLITASALRTRLARLHYLTGDTYAADRNLTIAGDARDYAATLTSAWGLAGITPRARWAEQNARRNYLTRAYTVQR